MDLSWIYRRFFLRDLLGYMLPGSIALFALIVRLDTTVVEAMFSDPPWWLVAGVCVPLTYVAGMVIQNFGVLFPLLVTDYGWGFLGNPAGRNRSHIGAFHFSGEIPCLREYERNLREKYRLVATIFGRSAMNSLVDRQIIFMHISGNTSIALSMLCLSRFGLRDPGSYAAEWLPLLHEADGPGMVWCVLVAAAVILLLAHYRYCRNLHVMLPVIKDIVGSRNASSRDKPE